METVLIRILQLILAFSILIVVHEFGHFIFSKMFKIRVEKFFLFFDPYFHLVSTKDKWLTKLFPRLRNSETEYGIGWLPLGGYVKIAGMIDESMDKEQMRQAPQPWEFRTKPAWQRLLVMTAGVIFNFLLALFIYAMILFTWGDSYLSSTTPQLGMDFSDTAKRIGFRDGDILLEADGKSLAGEANALFYPRRGGVYRNVELLRTVANARVVKVERNGKADYVHITDEMGQDLVMDSVYFASYRYPFVADSVLPGRNAAVAGLLKGDSIIAVDGEPILSYSDYNAYVGTHGGDSVSLSVVRGGKPLTLKVALDENKKMGVVPASEMRFLQSVAKHYSFLASFPAGARLGVKTLAGYVSDMKYVFTQKGASSIGGFGTIASIFPQMWDWHRFWEMTAFLSVILAFMNILPIPALDGGHVLFTLYEIITGRKPGDKFLEYAQVTGMVLLFGLLIWANLNDIIRFLF